MEAQKSSAQVKSVTILKNNKTKDIKINVIGGGLAGSECAYQLAKVGFNVVLYEMKPTKFSDAHKLDDLCELVCSNSLKNSSITNACGLLKEEMKKFDSLTMKMAHQCKVPAGGALAVDREQYARLVTCELEKMDNIEIVREEVVDFKDGINIIATGPLTSDNLFEKLQTVFPDFLYFYDAAAPIIEATSIDYTKAFFGDRYGKGDSDYLNCGMNKEEYLEFYENLINAQCVVLKSFEKREIFEGCMPVEVMAKRGVDTLRYGPMKPVGLSENGEKHYAVLQLRYENNKKNLFNMVGFQTNLTFKEQKRVFSYIPALKNAEYSRYGVMHRNTFLNSPKLLNKGCQLKSNPNIFFAGQITGVEGYVESAMSGLYTALQVIHFLKNETLFDMSSKTIMGALINYISTENSKFQPMNANFGILDTMDVKIKTRNKMEKYQAYADMAIVEIEKFKTELLGE